MRISAGMVGILLHSAHRDRTATNYNRLRAVSGVLSEMHGDSSHELRRASQNRLMDGTVLRRMQGAISYECRTELDFNNELKGDR